MGQPVTPEAKKKLKTTQHGALSFWHVMSSDALTGHTEPGDVSTSNVHAGNFSTCKVINFEQDSVASARGRAGSQSGNQCKFTGSLGPADHTRKVELEMPRSHNTLPCATPETPTPLLDYFPAFVTSEPVASQASNNIFSEPPWLRRSEPAALNNAGRMELGSEQNLARPSPSVFSCSLPNRSPLAMRTSLLYAALTPAMQLSSRAARKRTFECVGSPNRDGFGARPV